MRRKARSLLAVAALLLGGVTAVPAAQAQARDGGGGDRDAIGTWTGEVTAAQVPLLLKAGVDGHEIGARVPKAGKGQVEVQLSAAQAAGLREQGVRLTRKIVSPETQRKLRAQGDRVFRPYMGVHGLMKEMIDTARFNRKLAKVVSIGKTVKGRDIMALKLTKDADTTEDGAKPAVLYLSNQHAREWITPEMTRRLMQYYLAGYGKDPRLTKILDTTELWFVLSANPDGYDYTFESPQNRMWRKNLRDNNGDGKITPGDGVDLNRNFSYKWGYDNEGSSPNPSSETYRGPAAASEPETKALDAFEKRIGFRYAVNYHSAAELILYGVGWQVATPTPDDVLYRALAGTPEKPAIPGYRPQVSSELYTTNGEADGHASNVNGIPMFTPEMSTCQTASNADPNDEWNAADCQSVFTFPDSEKLIQAEFEKNIPFALSVAESAGRPDRPVSSVGMEAPDFTPHAFTTSYARGEEQQVAVTARKSVRDKELNYRVNGGRRHTEELEAWKGGERYGGEDNIHFDQYRAVVEGADPGDEVEVWFTGRTREGKATRSEPFTYTVAERPRADTLVIAEEGGTAPARHTAAYTRALAANGHRAAVWDVARQGTPDALGVLSHFEKVVWYTGAGRPGGATQLAVRDYLNEGGKLLTAGEQAGGSAVVGRAVSDDFAQYYLGAGSRISLKSPPAFKGDGKLAGTEVKLGDAPGNPLDAAGTHSVISDELPPATFPQFASAAAGTYPGVRSPFQPYEGDWFAAARHRDSSWMRLARTVDLTGVAASARPALQFMLSHDTETGYDNAVIEAHTVGKDDWTTLRDANGGTGTDVPAECGQGYYLTAHPFLQHYLTRTGTQCRNTGTTGAWNRFTGSSNGWRPVSVDLSAYAGQLVELVISYVTDPSTGGRGVFVDNTKVTTGTGNEPLEGFETSLGPWTTPGPPAGSPASSGDWTRSKELFRTAGAITTRDTVLLGFGLEHVQTAAQRAELAGAALDALDD
ncbi:zinc carboxypeptidase [Streptomyces albofaciens JCM 4342]|uniref:M14 family metallopeptidase n=1 Tax=Streptomyces albofaciens TaxID=66866 RepID=UPI00123AAE95|nr:M14 family metallopeptidase [Streptomyces albofaciens]KAA6222540.1 zinc carboxypeptidase [Streptomyces albofaciens JCM 4342]